MPYIDDRFDLPVGKGPTAGKPPATPVDWTYSGGDGQSKPAPVSDPPLANPDLKPPPPVPGGSDSPGKGVTTVNTKAMRIYASNIDSFVQPLKDSRNALQTVNVKPGTFPSALALSKLINAGDTGFRDATSTVLDNVVNALINVQDALNQMASKYDKAEDLNKLSASDYANFMATASGAVNAVVGSSGGDGGSSAAGSVTGGTGSGATPPPPNGSTGH